MNYTGSDDFQFRLICSSLSGRSVKFNEIRAQEVKPGLLEEEVTLLRLLQAISNGCAVEIDSKGTSCMYKPGLIVGGPINFENGTKRNLSYYLEPIAIIGLFGKKPLSLTLEGVTHDDADPSMEILRTVTLPLIAKICDIEDGLELKIVRRGAAPDGGGKVSLRVPVIKQVPSTKWTDEGMIKRIRGIAYSLKVSPQFTNRMIGSARGLLNNYLADVYIFADAVKGKESGNSPGYGINLVAETTTGCLISAEASAQRRVNIDKALSSPEDIGSFAAASLLEEIERGGVVDGMHQHIIILLCALGPELLSQVRLGPLTQRAVSCFRTIRDFFGVVFDFKLDKEHGTVFLSCVGIGLKNIARKVR